MKYCISLLWLAVGGTQCLPQTSLQSPQKSDLSTDQFKLLTRPRDFALQFVSNGKSRQIPIPRDWLVPPDEEKGEEGNYVSSFLYGNQVTSFPIGNGKIGLQLSSYEIQKEGLAQAAAGRDVFLIFDPASSAVFRGGIERGITKERVRSQGCFAAKADNYYLADVNGDGLTDIGVAKEELECVQSKKRQDVDLIVGPFYKEYPIAWYVFKGNGWQLDLNFSGKFPEKYLELPLIGMDISPVDVVGCNLWRTCDRTKWPTEER
jgi:hypothetical protein